MAHVSRRSEGAFLSSMTSSMTIVFTWSPQQSIPWLYQPRQRAFRNPLTLAHPGTVKDFCPHRPRQWLALIISHGGADKQLPQGAGHNARQRTTRTRAGYKIFRTK